MIHQELQLNFSQQLQLTPKLQQAIRMLQLSSQELLQELTQALEGNIMLELDSPLNDLVIPISQLNEPRLSEEIYYESSSDYREKAPLSLDKTNQAWQQATSDTLQSYLLWQLRASQFPDAAYKIGEVIICAINDEGYLTEDALEIQQHLKRQGIKASIKQINAVLVKIQGFEPLGVGATNLQQALLLQLNALPKHTPYLDLAKSILQQHLPLLATHQYKRLAQVCAVNANTLTKILDLIQSLNPRPGNAYLSKKSSDYISPDVLVIKKGASWHVKLNPLLLPKLRLNVNYLSLLDTQPSCASSHFINAHLREAKWLIQCVKQRNDTLLKVATGIIRHQQGFMSHGPGAINALILKDIADELKLHQSTVSRVSTKKYIQTPQGTFELKYFFSSHINTAYGAQCSALAIQSFIKAIIAAEDKHQPYSDNKLTQQLVAKGLNVARRTVSKYRESLKIPKAALRKHS